LIGEHLLIILGLAIDALLIGSVVTGLASALESLDLPVDEAFDFGEFS